MYYIIFGILFILAGAFATKLLPKKVPAIGRVAIAALSAVVGVFLLFATSYVNVPDNHIATLNRIYFAKPLPPGKVMMFDDSSTYKGPQAEYLTQGFHIRLFVNVLNDVTYVPLVEVPQGEYLLLVSREGETLPVHEFMAPEWSLPEDEMLKPTVFLTNGGYKGTQLTVLRPGKYPVHPALWQTQRGKALQVATGEVAVIRSNVQIKKGLDCTPIESNASAGGTLSTSLVPNGCKGVWVEPLGSGAYYLNSLAFSPSVQSTRAMVWNYKGCYTRREINLVVGEDGGITQKDDINPIASDPSNADCAVIVRTKDGWTIPIELRVPYQVYPKDASRVIAGVGSTDAIEDRVITPIINDLTRQIAGQTEAGELINRRAEIVQMLETEVIKEAAKAGVTVAEVRLDEIVLPPELLLPQRRSQLAQSLSATYAQEKLAAEARAQSERAKSLANTQHIVVTAEMNAKAAENRGRGLRDEMKLVAEGQKAQRDVIGAEYAVQLQIFDRFLEVAVKNPDIVKVPVINVQSGEGGAEGMAAVLGGSSNIAAFLKLSQEQAKAKPKNQ